MSPRVKTSLVVGLAVVVVVTLARSLTFLCWSDLYFDADQAVMGLMGKHIAEARAFPVLQYAFRYVLVLESWLGAPLMAFSSESVTLVKGVTVALNAATTGLLYVTVASVTQLGPAFALLATLPLALPGPIATNELTGAIGVNIEPLLFALVLWWVRERPVWLGVTAAVAVLTRELAL
jgi:hypothetical protein